MAIHAEAFSLMIYQCEKCNKRLLAWNSRDGVTPFIVNCRDPGCDGNARHLMRHMKPGANLDTLKATTIFPDEHKYVFINCSEEHAMKISKSFFHQWGDDLMERFPHLKNVGKETLINSKFLEIYGEGEQPRLVSLSEYTGMIENER